LLEKKLLAPFLILDVDAYKVYPEKWVFPVGRRLDALMLERMLNSVFNKDNPAPLLQSALRIDKAGPKRVSHVPAGENPHAR
jgi:hypothetical protein